MASHSDAHAAAGPHAVHHDPNMGTTGLDNRKVGMWIFLGSDCMFFGSLIGTYLSYKGKSLGGPTPQDVFNIPLTSESAAVLLLSSLTMVLALAALEKNDHKWTGRCSPPRCSARTSWATRSTSSTPSPSTTGSR